MRYTMHNSEYVTLQLDAKGVTLDNAIDDARRQLLALEERSAPTSQDLLDAIDAAVFAEVKREPGRTRHQIHHALGWSITLDATDAALGRLAKAKRCRVELTASRCNVWYVGPAVDVPCSRTWWHATDHMAEFCKMKHVRTDTGRATAKEADLIKMRVLEEMRASRDRGAKRSTDSLAITLTLSVDVVGVVLNKLEGDGFVGSERSGSGLLLWFAK
jgi:hypothetical protein